MTARTRTTTSSSSIANSSTTANTTNNLYNEKEVMEEFISCYRHFPALWNSSCNDYLSTEKKAPGYQELLNILRRINSECTVYDVKRKINSLRSCYRREYKKINDSQNGYEPRLWWFHMMDFLMPVLNLKPLNYQKQEQFVIKKESLDQNDSLDGDEVSMNFLVMAPSYHTVVTDLWQEFFRLYRSMPELWMVNSKWYRDRKLKAESYQRLLKHMQLIDPQTNIHLLKRKINNLRTCYRRELRKVLHSDQNYGDVYKPTLWYFKELEFLFELETGELQLQTLPQAKLHDHKDEGVNVGELALAKPERMRKETSHCVQSIQEAHHQSDRNINGEDDDICSVHDIEEDVLNLEGSSGDAEDFQLDTFTPDQSKRNREGEGRNAGGSTKGAETGSFKHKARKRQRRPNSSHINDNDDYYSDDCDGNDDGHSDYMTEKKLRWQPPTDHQAESECVLIGKRMAAHFRNMRPDQRLFAERIISEVLVYGRMNRLTLEARFSPSK